METTLFAFDDSWKFIIAIVFIIISVLNKFLSGNKEAKPAVPKKPVVKPREVPPVPNVRRAQQDEIDEFLRRAADNLKPKLQSKANRRQQQQSQKKQPPTRRLVEAATEITALPSSSHESVAEHVQKRLSSREFETRAANLTDDIQQADRQREQHRQQVFGHRVGTLTDTSVFEVEAPAQATVDATAAAAAAAGVPLASVLANPDSLRQAIILNEILVRPEQRWSGETGSYL